MQQGDGSIIESASKKRKTTSTKVDSLEKITTTTPTRRIKITNENDQRFNNQNSLVLQRYQIGFSPQTQQQTLFSNNNNNNGRSFYSVLMGNEGKLEPFPSPYSGRILKPFIWRDFEFNSTPKQKQLDGICNFKQWRLKCVHKESERESKNCVLKWINVSKDEEKIGENNNLNEIESLKSSIDYSFLKPKFVKQVNQILVNEFWPYIDISEFLEYPDYAICALYKEMVVGCGFVTPEGYIAYIAVHSEWRSAGIGAFMLYHLIQIVPDKDITLHVSANNPSMILYQKFGFKAEEFVVNFYHRYLPDDSTLCKHAFFMRMRR